MLFIRESKKVEAGDKVKIRYYHDVYPSLKPFTVKSVERVVYGVNEKIVWRQNSITRIIEYKPYARVEYWLTCEDSNGRMLNFPSSQVLEEK